MGAALIYAGSALGVVFAGDLLTLFFFWEIMSVSSTCLIFARKIPEAIKAGFRYFLVHLTGGLILLIGIILYFNETGSLSFNNIVLNSTGAYLIFLGFGKNCAWPVIHSWLPDAYPQATIAGAVFLSSFTTKTAVYVLARGFAGVDLLIWIGLVMTVFPIFYAVIENDLRRVLSYSLINQVGFMVVGIGIGTNMAINGVAAHAFAHILYKALLFMSMGAVLLQTGKIKATELGGLYKSMPITALCCIIGAASISAFPLFSGFVSKSIIMSAAGHEHLVLVWIVLLFASAGAISAEAGIKIPFFAFFSHDSGLRPKEPPLNMLVAMLVTAFLCLFIGIFPGYLYAFLPYPINYAPYTSTHIITQLQLLIFSALAFTLLLRSGIYPSEIRSLNIDSDWLYRKGGKAFLWFVDNPMVKVTSVVKDTFFVIIPRILNLFILRPMAVLLLLFIEKEKKRELKEALFSGEIYYFNEIHKYWNIGLSVLIIILLLSIYLLVFFLQHIYR